MQPCNGLISSFQSCMKQTCPCSYFRAAHCDFLLSFAANLQKTVTKMLLTCVSGWVTRSRAEVKWDLEIGPLLWHEKLLQLARTRRSAAGEHPDLLTERCNAPPPLIAAGSVCHVQGAAGVAFFFADEIRSQGTFPSLVITIPLLLKPPPRCVCARQCGYVGTCESVGVLEKRDRWRECESRQERRIKEGTEMCTPFSWWSDRVTCFCTLEAKCRTCLFMKDRKSRRLLVKEWRKSITYMWHAYVMLASVCVLIAWRWVN